MKWRPADEGNRLVAEFEPEKDADHPVKCVNAHDALFAALREFESFVKTVDKLNCTPDTVQGMIDLTSAKIKALESIQLAKGEQS